MDINSAKVTSEPKPANCTCNWPKERFRNGSGHDRDCPVHLEYLSRKGICNSGNCGCQ